LVFAAVAAGVIFAILGSWKPILGLTAITGLIGGLEVDRSGNPGRRALGLLGVATGLFALLIANLYA
jgi:hypothetical protein